MSGPRMMAGCSRSRSSPRLIDAGRRETPAGTIISEPFSPATAGRRVSPNMVGMFGP